MLIQTKIVDATHDITVAWVKGKSFAFQLDRQGFQGDDVRFLSAEDALEWCPCDLAMGEIRVINEFMDATGLSFGRLDFLRGADGTLWFLEVNPNGQFAWLDLKGEYYAQ